MIGSRGRLPLSTGSPVRTGVLVLPENSCPFSHKKCSLLNSGHEDPVGIGVWGF